MTTLMNWLHAAIEWLTPDALKDDVHTRKRVRMFIISHTFGPFTGAPIPLSLYIFDPAPWPHVPILGASIMGFWLFLPLLKMFPRHYTLLALISIVNLNFAMLWGSFHYGGASSPFLIWYSLMPVLAFFYLGASMMARLAVFSQVVIGLGLFTLGYVLSGESFPVHIPLENMVYAGMISAFSATTYAFFMAVYYSSVVDSQSELIKEISRHEHTLAELTVAQKNMEITNRALQWSKNLAEARNLELERTKASLEYNALHDALTGLPNRRYLDQHLSKLSQSSGHGKRGVALLHVDLDRFKQINDTLGHVAGDEMLSHVSRLLKASVGEDDFVARVGGDEFIVVCQMDESECDVLSEKAEQLIEKIRQPVPYQGHLCRLGASIGIAMDNGARIDAKNLLVNSDIALYRAKERSRGSSEFFSEEVQLEIINNKRIADDILRGIEQHEFITHYQPQFDAASHDIVGVEALVRWNHPSKGVLSPFSFLKIAEDLNVLNAIDRMIMDRALVDFARWERLGLAIPKVAVNVSARRLKDRELIDSLKNRDIKPGTLAFELVESVFLDETEESIAYNIEGLKTLGIEIEIDDFGTGYASIVSLLKLNPKRLKIDRQFVAPILTSPEKRRLVSSIIDMGKSLGIEVVAEGVETMEQARILNELGCDVLQGYAFAKPMPAENLEIFVRQHVATPRILTSGKVAQPRGH